MTDGNVSPGSLFLPSELRGAGARSLWPGWADRARFRPEGSCSLGCPPGAHVRAGAHGTGWGRRGRAQLCALPRCQSPLLLALQGPGPRDCEGAQEQEDGADGSPVPGGWPPGGRRGRSSPVPPRGPPHARPAHPVGAAPARLPVSQLWPVVLGRGGRGPCTSTGETTRP